MTVTVNMFVVGTKDRPIFFLDPNGVLTPFPECAMFYMDICNAEADIHDCDEPDKFTIYKVDAKLEGV